MVIPPLPFNNYVQLLVASKVAAQIGAYSPVGFRSGGETWFDGSGAFVLPDAPSWGRVWDRHIQNEQIGNVGVNNLNPAPAVDFTKNLVVALFAGPQPGVVGYRLVKGYQIGKKAYLQLAPAFDGSQQARVAVPRPWAFLVLPRSTATVEIQLPKGDGGWSTVATVPPSQ